MAMTAPSLEPVNPAATKTEPFLRRRHLALALASLAHAPMTTVSASAVMAWIGARAWSAEVATLDAVSLLVFPAFVAWLAFDVLDTHAEVTLLPRRWRDLGLVFGIWWVGLELIAIGAAWNPTQDDLAQAQWWFTAFAPDGTLRIGWACATMLAHATAEEIVYRGLLLRALEGYMKPIRALLVHAVVFELVHAFVYGYGLTGGRLLPAIMMGVAFQRTRSIGVPTLLHFAHNALLFVVAWYAVR